MTVRTPTPAPRGATPALPSPTGATSHRVVLMAGVAAAVVVLAALLTGTAPRSPLDGLPDAGRLVGWGLRLGRAGLDLSLMATLGCLTVRLLLGPRSSTPTPSTGSAGWLAAGASRSRRWPP